MSHSSKPGLGAIARNVRGVLWSFRSLLLSLNEQGDVEDRPQDSLQDDSGGPYVPKPPPRFEDESTRFKMWAGNLGAHQSGRASLDYRLREAPHLHDQVIYLLEDLSQSLQDALQMVNSESEPEPETEPETRPMGAADGNKHRTPSLQSDDGLDQSSEDSFTDSVDNDVPFKDRLTGLYVDVKEAIDCLLRLSVAIANPVPHERVRILGVGPREDISFRETYDIGYVQDKFPAISAELATYLGKALTRRRQFFKYREAHRARLASGLDMDWETTEHGDTSRTEVVPKTVASPLPEHLKTLKDVDPRTNLFDQDNRSDAGISQTSYATSAEFLASDLDGGQARHMKPPPPLRVPPRPAGPEHQTFECPFCYRIVFASTRAAWK